MLSGIQGHYCMDVMNVWLHNDDVTCRVLNLLTLYKGSVVNLPTLYKGSADNL
jgi:hypothetical protein